MNDFLNPWDNGTLIRYLDTISRRYGHISPLALTGEDKIDIRIDALFVEPDVIKLDGSSIRRDLVKEMEANHQVGITGKGKETLAKWLAFAFSSPTGGERYMRNLGSLVPLPMDFRLLSGKVSTADDLLFELRRTTHGLDLTEEVVIDLLTRGQCLFILEGISELESKSRAETKKAIDETMSMYPGNHWIIMLEDSEDAKDLPIDLLQIAPFNDHQISELLSGWSKLYKIESKTLADRISKYRRKCNSELSIAEVNYIISLARFCQFPPITLPSLYRAVINTYIAERAYKDVLPPNIAIGRIRRALEIVAFNMQQIPDHLATENQIISWVTPALGHELAAKFLHNAICRRGGLMPPRTKERAGFIDTSTREYLAAKHMRRQEMPLPNTVCPLTDWMVLLENE